MLNQSSAALEVVPSEGLEDTATVTDSPVTATATASPVSATAHERFCTAAFGSHTTTCTLYSIMCPTKGNSAVQGQAS